MYMTPQNVRVAMCMPGAQAKHQLFLPGTFLLSDDASAESLSETDIQTLDLSHKAYIKRLLDLQERCIMETLLARSTPTNAKAKASGASQDSGKSDSEKSTKSRSLHQSLILCSAVPETLRTSGIHGIFSLKNKPPSRRAESGPGAASDRARRAPRASPRRPTPSCPCCAWSDPLSRACSRSRRPSLGDGPRSPRPAARIRAGWRSGVRSASTPLRR